MHSACFYDKLVIVILFTLEIHKWKEGVNIAVLVR